jgi:flagellar protein FlaG
LFILTSTFLRDFADIKNRTVSVKERKIMTERISPHANSSYLYSKVRNENSAVDIQQKELNNVNDANQETQLIVSKKDLEEVVQGLNKFLQPSHTQLKFKLHEDLEEYYVQIIDEKTKEVVREIPPKKLLDMYAKMMELVGLVVDKKI